MSQRAFTAAMEALQREQESHIRTMRVHAAALMEISDLHPEQVAHYLSTVDEAEARRRELLSAIALLHAMEME